MTFRRTAISAEQQAGRGVGIWRSDVLDNCEERTNKILPHGLTQLIPSIPPPWKYIINRAGTLC